LTPAGQQDSLFGEMPEVFDIFSGHKGSIIKEELPTDAISLLGWTENTPVSAFRIKGTRAYGIQQHPEADKEYVREVDANFEMLTGSGLNPYKRTHDLIPPHNSTGRIFGNFGELVFRAR
jgi:GMP synthase-like glutamine amidotransferase